MESRVRKVEFCSLSVPNRAGQAAQVLGVLKEAGVNLIAFTGAVTKGGRARFDLVSDELVRIRRLATQHRWRLGGTRKGFLVQGLDEVGAVYQHIQKLADRKIDVAAADAVAAGKGLFGMILWVRPKDYLRASRTLGAR